MNRRGNGLSAEAYTPLADLSSQLADLMLTALRDAGIAAYAFDQGGDSPADAGGEAGRSARPLDRLYVDSDVKQAAEDVLRAQLRRLSEEYAHDPASSGGQGPDSPDVLDIGGMADASEVPDTAGDRDTGGPAGEPSGSSPTASSGTPSGPASRGGTDPAELDEAAIWAQIVASYEETPADGATPWPDEENLAPRETGDSGEDGDDRKGDDTDETDDLDATGLLATARVIKPAEPDFDADEEEDEHYIPPPPPPLPTGDSVTRSGWLALVGGPLYILVAVLLDWEVPGWAAFTAVAAFIGGFVTLVLRMGDEPRDPDDGAVV